MNLRLTLPALLLATVYTFGCSSVAQNNAGPCPFTGRSLTALEVRKQVPAVAIGDTYYAEVNSVWLHQFYSVFRAELFRLGVARWNKQFDCHRFAEFYTGMAQAYFYRESFKTPTKAVALALGPVWYTKENGARHAIVRAITERGVIFIEPQNGNEVTLSDKEFNSIFTQYF